MEKLENGGRLGPLRQNLLPQTKKNGPLDPPVQNDLNDPSPSPCLWVLLSIGGQWASLIQKLVLLIVGPLLYGLVSLTAGPLT